MKKVFAKLLALSLMLLTLTGCFFKTAEELFLLPKMPENYTDLQNKINEITSQLGAETISPLLGSNTANVQLQDLDTSGKTYTIAFFQVAEAEHPLKIYIFAQDDNGDYYVAYLLEGDGTAINAISYPDLNGDGTREIVVSWQLSSRVHVLEVFALSGESAVEIMRAAYSDQYLIYDLDQDSQQELLVVQTDESGESANRVEFYDYDAESFSMVLQGSAPLSTGIASVQSADTGYLTDNVPALYVVSSARSGGTITDIFALQDGTFANILLDPETGCSVESVSYSIDVAATDINSDAILELPMPEPIPEYNATGQASNFLAMKWRQYDVNGNPTHISTTYHNVSDGWYLDMPDRWEGKITIYRDDSRSNRGERTVIFARWDGEADSAPVPFLAITRITGTNRSLNKRSTQFTLCETSGAVYLAEFYTSSWDCGLTEETLPEAFHLITNDWSGS